MPGTDARRAGQRDHARVRLPRLRGCRGDMQPGDLAPAGSDRRRRTGSGGPELVPAVDRGGGRSCLPRGRRDQAGESGGGRAPRWPGCDRRIAGRSAGGREPRSPIGPRVPRSQRGAGHADLCASQGRTAGLRPDGGPVLDGLAPAPSGAILPVGRRVRRPKRWRTPGLASGHAFRCDGPRPGSGPARDRPTGARPRAGLLGGRVSERPLRIVFVINSLGAGGAERSLAELAIRLVAAGHEPTFATFVRRPEGFEGLVRDHGISIELIPGRGLPSWTRSLRRFVRRVRPDVVHTTIFEADVAGRLAAFGTGIPVVSSLINVTYGPERLLDPNVRRWKLWGVRQIDGLTARRFTTHLHAVSRSVKDAAVRSLRIRPERVTVVERGRDPDRLGFPTPERRERARRELGIPTDAEVVLSVRRAEAAGPGARPGAYGAVPRPPGRRAGPAGRRGPARPALAERRRGRCGHRGDGPGDPSRGVRSSLVARGHRGRRQRAAGSSRGAGGVRRGDRPDPGGRAPVPIARGPGP